MVTPAGIGVEGGEFSRDPKALQTASAEAIASDQEFVRICSQLPGYSNDREAFYALRKKMSDIALHTNEVAAAVATGTGQATPAPLPALPTAASAVASNAGVDQSTAVANPPAATGTTASVAPAAGGDDSVAKLQSAVSKLKKASNRKTPKKRAARETAPAHT